MGVTGNAPFTSVGNGNAGPGSGGLAPNANGTADQLLSLWMNSNGNATAYIQVTVSFIGDLAKGVNATSFALHDIDQGSYTDEIRSITALNGATVVNPSSVTNTGSTSDTITGSGATYKIDGSGNSDNNSSQGDAVITFSSTITQFSFIYGNPVGLTGINSAQHVQLGDINFTSALPEVGPGICCLLTCTAALCLAPLRRRPKSLSE